MTDIAHKEDIIFIVAIVTIWASQVVLMVKNPPANTRDSRDISSIPECREDPLVQGMAIHSSIFAWRIPRTEKPRGLQFTVLQSQ